MQRRRAALLMLMLALAPGCAPAADAPLVILAAASLEGPLRELATTYEARTGARVIVSPASSSRLAAQIHHGVEASIFLSASERWMDEVEAKGRIAPQTRRALLSNSLVMVVPQGRAAPPLEAARLSALERVALAEAQVPVGARARESLRALGLWEAVAPRVVAGADASRTLAWVAAGEADAGFVYRTDALGEPRVMIAHELPSHTHATIRYVGARLQAAPDPARADALLQWLSAPEAMAVWRAAGFTPPPADATTAAARPTPERAIDLVGITLRSLWVALACALLGFIPAVALGYALARGTWRGKALVSALVYAPLVVPPVVTGLALLTLLGREGVLGAPLAAAGLPIAFGQPALVLAALVVGLPLYVMSARRAFEAIPARHEELGRSLGMSRWQVWRVVTLPLALPGILGGASLAFARALGEFGATIVFAGNIPGQTQTLSLAIYSALEDPARQREVWILAGICVALSWGSVLLHEGLTRRRTLSAGARL